jgi:uncharacterized membrane protein HdeD (DUF308 family)
VVNRRFLALLFLSSYSPVFLLLALRSSDRSCTVFWLAAALLILSLAALGVFFLSARRKAAYEVTVVKIEFRTADVAAYVVTYLLPFLGVFGDGWRDVLALGLFIVLIGVIYVNSGMLYINPLLALLGYHLLLVGATTLAQGQEADDLQPQYLLTKDRWLRPGQRLTVRDVMPDTLFALPSDNRDDA